MEDPRLLRAFTSIHYDCLKCIDFVVYRHSPLIHHREWCYTRHPYRSNARLASSVVFKICSQPSSVNVLKSTVWSPLHGDWNLQSVVCVLQSTVCNLRNTHGVVERGWYWRRFCLHTGPFSYFQHVIENTTNQNTDLRKSLCTSGPYDNCPIVHCAHVDHCIPFGTYKIVHKVCVYTEWLVGYSIECHWKEMQWIRCKIENWGHFFYRFSKIGPEFIPADVRFL